jgi:hypothetical protein
MLSVYVSSEENGMSLENMKSNWLKYRLLKVLQTSVNKQNGRVYLCIERKPSTLPVGG